MSELLARQADDRRASAPSADYLLATDPEAARAINQRIFETSLDLILVVDRKGNFIRVSPSCEAILGYRADEMVGRSAADSSIRPTSTAPATRCAWRAAAGRCAISSAATATRAAAR